MNRELPSGAALRAILFTIILAIAAGVTVRLQTIPVRFVIDLPDGAPAPRALTRAPTATAEPPVAARRPVKTKLHGRERVDEYAWLREKEHPEVDAYLEAENAYAAAILAPIELLRAKLEAEMAGYTAQSAPELDRMIWIPQREGKAGMLTIGGDAGSACVSDDGKFAAYISGGDRDDPGALWTLDLHSGEKHDEGIRGASDLCFAKDGSIIYVNADGDHKSRVMRHVMGPGGPASTDSELFAPRGRKIEVSCARSRGGDFLIITSRDEDATEVRAIPAADPLAKPIVLFPRKDGQHARVDQRNDVFTIVINDDGDDSSRVVTAPTATASPVRWRELVAHRAGVQIEDVRLFAGKVAVLIENRDGLPNLERLDLETGTRTAIPLPDELCELSEGGTGLLSMNSDFNSTTFRYTLETLAHPRVMGEVDISDVPQRGHRLAPADIGLPTPTATFDSSRYETRRLTAKARDGTQIPVSLVYRAGTKPDGKSPLLLYGFGAYGTALPSSFCPCFAPERLPLLDRGVVFAIAHVRGGDEKGDAWHEAARGAVKKMTSFNDFIDVAESLTASGWGARGRIAAMGESAGGLLVTASTNLRPDLFRAVLALYPFVDCIDTMLDESLPGTTDEFEEWGNPKEVADFQAMSKWSPYDNLAAVSYPGMLLRGAVGDDEVMFWEPAKYTARMRAVGKGTRPIVMITSLDPKVGHLGPSDPREHLRDRALEFAFILRELGVE